MRSGMIAVVGRPNVGKSTLINALCGQKVAIVSDKPQTTRTRLCAAVNIDGVQLIFMDTPGFHKPKNRLDEYMRRVVDDSFDGVDAVLLLVEPVNRIGKPEAILLDRIKNSGIPCVLAINKIDTADKLSLLPVIELYGSQYTFAACIPVCAKSGDGVSAIGTELAKLMPEGPQLFPDGMISDCADKQFACETVREKLLWLLREEIPHGIAVVPEVWEDTPELLHIGVLIVCEKESHKAIVIGKNGAVLKKTGEMARADLESHFKRKVFLETWVKVKNNWRDSETQLRNFGFQ
jgi:GTP-binding protein Era